MARPHHEWSLDGNSPRQIEDDRSIPSHRYSKSRDQGHNQVNDQHRHCQSQHQTREMMHLPGTSSFLTPISPPPLLRPPPPRAVPLSAVVTTTAPASYTRRPSYHGDYATPSPVGQTKPQMPASSGGQHPMYGPMQQRRAVDHGLSPTQSSICSSDRSDELELARYQNKGRSSMSSCSTPSSSVAAVSVAALGAPLAANAIAQTTRILDRTAISSPDMANYDPRAYTRRGSGQPNPGNNQPALSSPSLSHHSYVSSPRESNQMSILNILSGHTDGVATVVPAIEASPTRSKAPVHRQYAPLSPAATSEFRLVIRQQPVAARSCGFGERDRRVIDPPPIVQLLLTNTNLSPEETDRRLQEMNCAVTHCSIWSEDGETDFSAMPEDFRQQRRLMGSTAATPFVGYDEKGEKGYFFCFPDLSCRTPGRFRLKYSLVAVNPVLDRIPGAKKSVAATVFSEPFTVYNAKDFPGMQASTALTKKLKEQGCLISIKKGNEKSNEKSNVRAHHSGSEDEYEDNDDDGRGAETSKGKGKGSARKKQKTR